MTWLGKVVARGTTPALDLRRFKDWDLGFHGVNTVRSALPIVFSPAYGCLILSLVPEEQKLASLSRLLPLQGLKLPKVTLPFIRSGTGTGVFFSASGAHLSLYLFPKARTHGDSAAISR